MKQKLFFGSLLSALLAVMLSVGLTSCGGDDSESDPTPPPPTPVEETITVDLSSITFEVEGGETSIQVTSNAAWTVSGKASWLTINPESVQAPSSGTEKKVVKLSAGENKTKDERSCTLTFTTTDEKSVSVVVTQKKPSPEILVNGLNATTLKFEGAFDGKSGVDFKQSVNITSNVTWSATDVPNWLSISPTNGNGTVSMTIYPTSENISSTDREATIKLKGDGAEANIVVVQTGSLPSVKVTPANLVALYNQIGWELKATGDVNKFQQIVVTEAVHNRKTDKELLEDILTDEAEKFADDYIFFYSKDSYGNNINPNSTYYICSVAYDANDNRGEVIKTKITTPSYLDADNDAWVSFSDVSANRSQGFQFTATREGYCNTYHAIYGNLPSSYTYNSVLYAFEINYFIKNSKKHWFAQNWNLEIVTDYPNNHTFTHYTSDLTTNPLIVVYAWGVFKDGRISSDLQGFRWDISEEESASPRRASRNTNIGQNQVIRRSVEAQRAKLHRR